MGVKKYLQKASYVWRIKYYIESLESRTEKIPETYDDEKKRFLRDLKGYSTTNAVYLLVMPTFYASIVTSATAALGFEVYVFEKVYSVLGFTTVGALYFITRYLRRLALLDLQNSKVRVISLLSAAESGPKE